MKLISRVTNKDVGHLIFTLAEARKRPQSENFLEGFPWLSVIWYKVEDLAVLEFENLYLFWDGVAWGNKEELPRRLKQGTKDFMDMVADNIVRLSPPDSQNCRLCKFSGGSWLRCFQ